MLGGRCRIIVSPQAPYSPEIEVTHNFTHRERPRQRAGSYLNLPTLSLWEIAPWPAAGSVDIRLSYMFFMCLLLEVDRAQIAQG